VSQPLSPAAQALVAAFDDRYENCGPFDDNWQELCIAAVLRELAAFHGDPESFGAVRPEQLERLAAQLEATYSQTLATEIEQHLQAQARIILNELRAARELAHRVGRDPALLTPPYLDMLRRLYLDEPMGGSPEPQP
jgi:hypothetical protein